MTRPAPSLAAVLAIAAVLTPIAAANGVRWPEGAPAERVMQEVQTMFVESTPGGPRAWIVTGAGRQAEAVDFFTGQRSRAEVETDTEGRPGRAFRGQDRRTHVADPAFVYTDQAAQGGIPGVSFATGVVHLSASQAGCSTTLTVNTTAAGGQILVVHDSPGPGSCTMLAVVDCVVVRLKKEDLTPFGKAEIVRVVDAGKAQALAAAAPRPVSDAVAYLLQGLGLTAGTVTACKE
jgi:hypothetical protein